jgi:hypothetical protein
MVRVTRNAPRATPLNNTTFDDADRVVAFVHALMGHLARIGVITIPFDASEMRNASNEEIAKAASVIAELTHIMAPEPRTLN